jgi:hypothetical protein
MVCANAVLGVMASVMFRDEAGKPWRLEGLTHSSSLLLLFPLEPPLTPSTKSLDALLERGNLLLERPEL